MRKNIVAGNWKMNKTYAEAQELMAQLLDYKKNNNTNCEVYIAPPALYLTAAKEVFKMGKWAFMPKTFPNMQVVHTQERFP